MEHEPAPNAAAMPVAPEATRAMEEFASSSAERSGLPEPQRTEARLELLSHVFEAARERARADGSTSIALAHARFAIAAVGDTAAADTSFFAPQRAQLKPASLFVRGIAFALEWGILVGFTFMFMGIFAGPFGFLWWGTPVVQFTIASAVLVLFEGTTGQTPAKMLFRLRVVKKDGSPIDMEKAILRNLTKIFPGIVFLDALFGWLAFPDRGTRLSDKYAGTLVVKEVR